MRKEDDGENCALYGVGLGDFTRAISPGYKRYLSKRYLLLVSS